MDLTKYDKNGVPLTDEYAKLGSPFYHAGDDDSQPEPPPVYERFALKEFTVAGVSFHHKHIDDLWDNVEEGMELLLVREPRNKYDKNAVAIVEPDVFFGDSETFNFDLIVGYVPRVSNTEIAAMIDAGYGDKLKAVLTKYDRHAHLNNRLGVTVYLESREPVKPRPDLLRFHSQNEDEMKEVIRQLQQRGSAYLRFGSLFGKEDYLPIVGDQVVVSYFNKSTKAVMMYCMRIIAMGPEAAPYLEDPSVANIQDAFKTYVLTNVAGPVMSDAREMSFLGSDTLDWRSADNWLKPSESDALKDLFRRKTMLP